MGRRVAVVAAAVGLVVPVAGCGLFGSDSGAQQAAERFLAALSAGDVRGAAGLTDAAESAGQQLDSVRRNLAPTSVRTVLKQVQENNSGSGAGAQFSITWDLGAGRLWTYDGHFDLVDDDDTWRVHWAPTVLHPQLAAQQTLAVQADQPQLAPVLDRDGTPLMTPQTVISVLVDAKGAGDVPKVATQLAGVLKRFDKTVTPQSIIAGVGKAGAAPYQVILLRDSDYRSVKSQIYDLPGVKFGSSTRLLAVDKKFAPLLLGQVRALVDKQIEGSAGWRVEVLNPTGTEVQELFSKPAQPATAITLTISRKVQAAAQAALATEPTKGMIVAVQPSTGELLAVAQNAKADADGLAALTGRYPPGSTFKIITGGAAIESGLATVNSPQPCPGTMTIGTRAIPNNNKFDKGTIPLHEAFAVSCNTTFANLAAKMPPNLLGDTARTFGLGVDYVLPGITTVTGSVPPATDESERAEDGFGQGKVLASPFGMALVAATVQSGTLRLPTLVRGTTTRQDAPVAQVPQATLTALRSMMREVVTAGHAGQLRTFPDAHGKTGTAQFGDGTHAHGWFVGYAGDVAFATLLVDAGVSVKAANASARFITGV